MTLVNIFGHVLAVSAANYVLERETFTKELQKARDQYSREAGMRNRGFRTFHQGHHNTDQFLSDHIRNDERNV
jgi:hypothetical protein